jgi:hypothetical protein
MKIYFIKNDRLYFNHLNSVLKQFQKSLLNFYEIGYPSLHHFPGLQYLNNKNRMYLLAYFI